MGVLREEILEGHRRHRGSWFSPASPGWWIDGLQERAAMTASATATITKVAFDPDQESSSLDETDIDYVFDANGQRVSGFHPASRRQGEGLSGRPHRRNLLPAGRAGDVADQQRRRRLRRLTPERPSPAPVMGATGGTMAGFVAEREKMVQRQIARRGIWGRRLLDAFLDGAARGIRARGNARIRL